MSFIAKLRVLGCSGGIGSGAHTSSYLLNDNILIEAGTGVTLLSLEEITKIEHVFITHAHLDHIACLPLLLDSTMENRTEPLNVWASRETIDILKNHLFNYKIWPDFAALPTLERPFMRYVPLDAYQSVQVGQMKITPVPVSHGIPTFAYLLKNIESKQKFMLCGDTTVTDELWQFINQQKCVVGIAIESAFSSNEEWLAHLSKHLSSNLLLTEIEKLEDDKIIVYVMHLKPNHVERIVKELAQYQGRFNIQVFFSNQIVKF